MHSAALILSSDALEAAYGAPVLARLRSRVKRLTIIAPSTTWSDHVGALGDVRVIFSGWGAPRMDARFLRHVPGLEAVFYAGGSVRYFVSEAFWERRIRLTTAQAINAIPVAEYAASALQLGLKRFWHYAALTRTSRDFPLNRPLAGAYGSTIGLVSYGTIARLVRQRLHSLDVRVVVYDPFLGDEEARREQVERVSLEQLFATADAISIHTPHLPETERLVQGCHVAAMRSGAFLLNTARGEVLDEPALIEVLRRRPDLTAVLDVTAPEPPRPDSALYTLPNVHLTPHIAGSVGAECLRMGEAMIDEYERFCSGQPLRWEINAARAEIIA